MNYDLPTSVEINHKTYPIRNKCDYRVVLDAIAALNDNELSDTEKVYCALYIFYEDLSECDEPEIAAAKMMEIINNGEKEDCNQNQSPLMDWGHDFKIIAAPVNRVLGYEIRTPGKYTHWWTFMSAYMEIGECTFASVVSIRKKKKKGQKLENWEQAFYSENRQLIDLPEKLTVEEEEWFNRMLGGEA